LALSPATSPAQLPDFGAVTTLLAVILLTVAGCN
jgi:hypothetical protein